MSYQRIISSLGCAELNLPDALALAARHGLDGLELRALGGTLDLPAYLERHHGTPDTLARRLRASRERIAVFDTSLRLTGSSSVDREEFLQFIPWAEALGVPWLRVFDGDCAFGSPGEDEALETIRWWRELRRQHGWQVDCIVETHDALLDVARISRFVAAAPGTKILWDTHHTWKRGEDPLATWQAICAHVAHVHVKDSISRPSREHSFTYTIPGGGEFPMAPLARVLREEFRGMVSLEWERLWHPYLPPLDTALAAATAAAWW